MIAAHQAQACACEVMVDAFAGCGGNAIQFAMTCNQVGGVGAVGCRVAGGGCEVGVSVSELERGRQGGRAGGRQAGTHAGRQGVGADKREGGCTGERAGDASLLVAGGRVANFYCGGVSRPCGVDWSVGCRSVNWLASLPPITPPFPTCFTPPPLRTHTHR